MSDEPEDQEHRRRFGRPDLRLVTRVRRSLPSPAAATEPVAVAAPLDARAGEVDEVVSPYWLPPGRFVDLPGRGTTWVHELPAPADAPDDRPPLILLHGWTATGALNWFPAFRELNRTHRVLSIDHRGHGRGIKAGGRFRLEDCADDVVALADELGIARFVPVGYSMGGPIAQLVWKGHADRVAGLVLCATSRNFAGRPFERAMFTVMSPMAVAARVTPGTWQRQMTDRMLANRFDDDAGGRWATDEKRRSDVRMLVEAGLSLGRFSSGDWIGGVDVPTAVVLTQLDSLVPPRRQQRLADSIAGATVHPVLGDHTVCVVAPELFVPALVEAVTSVSTRIDRRGRATG